ncbi:MAG: TIGR02996 domain-containing protein [Planctomycetia bacterium]|nr:TIGR02996 domain-containing protein [Planctomycetia bacterium]
MARNPELIRAIFRQTRDDNVRLVYADWLDENDPKHAELIRVQCELAKKTCTGNRRKQLQAREKELLAEPQFHIPGHRPFEYQRGFVAEDCSVWFEGSHVTFRSRNPEFADEIPFSLYLRATDVPVLDRVLNLKLDLAAIPARAKMNTPVSIETLRRVTVLDCSRSYCAAEPAALAALQKCKHFECATGISFWLAREIPLDAIVDLALSDALPYLDHIYLDGEEWFTADGDEVGDDELAAFVTRIGASEKAAQLTYLQLNWQIGPKTVQAFLDAPHLKPTDQLCLPLNKGLKPTAKTALKKKFGKALVL